MIQVERLYKSFNGEKVLDNISFHISQGEIVSILGQSGTGKSVLLKHLIGLLKPDSGKIIIEGEDITCLSEESLLPLRKSAGYLFQEGALYDFMDVYENVVFPLREHTRLKTAEMREKVLRVLKEVGLEGVEAKYPSELSGGMRKRAALARAIVLDSKILFCDEPTSGLDPIRSREISDVIRECSQKMRCTTVIASHDIENSFRISDRLILLRDGKIIAMGKPEELRKNQEPFVQSFITRKDNVGCGR